MMAKKKVKKIEEPAQEQETHVCGHRNTHYTAGVLTCQMDKTHTGLHSAFLNGSPTFWSDAAGTPARKHA